MKILETLISFNSDHEPTSVRTYEYNNIEDYVDTFEDVDYKIKVISGGFIVESLYSSEQKASMISIESENKVDSSDIYNAILNDIKSSKGSIIVE
jgi:spore coat protein CotF